MLFAHNGGMWRAGPELLTLLSACGDLDIAVLPDLYGIPVQVEPQVLSDVARQRWQEQMNAWLVEYQALAQLR